MTLKRFNVRVYFFLLDRPLIDGGRPDPESQVLLSDEFLSGRDCTKLPGGGLEFGEGPMDCAHREALEELGQAIELGPLVHVTGNFVRSAWRGEEQVLCHYYLATLPDPANFRVAEARFDYPGEDLESFRWTPLRSLAESELTFGVDHAALAALRGRIG
jgi:8-oxo-dGTP diphosphatase